MIQQLWLQHKARIGKELRRQEQAARLIQQSWRSHRAASIGNEYQVTNTNKDDSGGTGAKIDVSDSHAKTFSRKSDLRQTRSRSRAEGVSEKPQSRAQGAREVSMRPERPERPKKATAPELNEGLSFIASLAAHCVIGKDNQRALDSVRYRATSSLQFNCDSPTHTHTHTHTYTRIHARTHART